MKNGDAVGSLGGGETDARGYELFRRLLLASVSQEVLADVPADLIDAESAAAFTSVLQKPRGSHRLRWRTAMTPLGALTAVDIVNDDMPFLVDSVVGEISARGLKLHGVLHPIYKAERDADGALVAITAPGDRDWSDGRQESFISLYLDPVSETLRQAIGAALAKILDQVRVVVADWREMSARLGRAIVDLRLAHTAAPATLRDEAVAFLKWLHDDQFTLLGMREYGLTGSGDLVPVDGSGLGVLRDPAVEVLRRGASLVAMTPEVRRFFESPDPLIVTKANAVSRVHRRVHMDYVGVKLYGTGGRPRGELRIVGLLTSSAYTQSPRVIPMLRHKVAEVVARSGTVPESHDGKALLNVLETFPRDELFQIGVDDLSRWAGGIVDLDLRPRVRTFIRRDSFDRFVSVLAYVPRDRFSTTIRERIGALLAERFDGYVAAFYPHFAEGPLVRVHFIVGRVDGAAPEVPESVVEADIRSIIETWTDRLAALLPGDAAASRLARAFPPAYADTFSPERAIADIERLAHVTPENPVAVDFYRDPTGSGSAVRVAIYRLDGPMRLSERVPVLENLGFTVVDERTFELSPEGASGRLRKVVLHDMLLETAEGAEVDIGGNGERLEDAFLAIWRGDTESDGFNRLITAADLDWWQAAMFRAYATYLRQLGSPFGLRYVADTLAAHPAIVRGLLALFSARFDPDVADPSREDAQRAAAALVETALATVPSLDEDRIVRQLIALLAATVRTSFYCRPIGSRPSGTIAFKLSGRELTMAPEPRTFREIWVWSPRVEGVHLRFAAVARGGIRWSDRPLDFRTEVLGLAKAQQVKNAVIVPAGAKGGFVPKRLPRGGSRDDIQKEGIAAYTIFISAMLDLTDDIRDGATVPPHRVVRHDGDDPYLVVAADKGTATFSDIANDIATRRSFWLGDAFASGGSAGYDHKKLAITSRGAWECIKRHFREMDRDIQTQPFTVAGVGDMSGDVFGNGMLLSRETRLVAAFDHRDIFIDPDPDPALSWQERKRLFDLPRSSWQDYDHAKISKGGGVYARGLKAIELSAEARAVLGIETARTTPAELMRAILQAGTDLVYFGGIGTFIRASGETDADAGDRANDAIRIPASAIRAKVVGEGANLGVTQRARVELSMRGVRLNADFIDNSAGVNTSDQEVNLKIALSPAVAAGVLSPAGRNDLLASVVGDVTRAVLRNNYQQSLALSLAERNTATDLPANARLLRALETRGLLERGLEALPTDRTIAERQRSGQGFVRPELAVLTSYAKIALLQDLLASSAPDDPGMLHLLADYFPPAVQERFPKEIAAHRLGREIVATTLTNMLVNRLGAATPLSLAEEGARPAADAAFAFMAARSVFDLPVIWAGIDALDDKVGGELQLGLYDRVRGFAVAATGRYLRIASATADLAETITRHRQGIETVEAAFPSIAPPSAVERLRSTAAALTAAGAPSGLARALAWLDAAADLPSAMEIAQASKCSAIDAARILLATADMLQTGPLTARAATIPAADIYDRLAIAGALTAIADARSSIASAILALGEGPGAVETWKTRHAGGLARALKDVETIVGSGDLTVARLTVAASRLAELASRG